MKERSMNSETHSTLVVSTSPIFVCLCWEIVLLEEMGETGFCYRFRMFTYLALYLHETDFCYYQMFFGVEFRDVITLQEEVH